MFETLGERASVVQASDAQACSEPPRLRSSLGHDCAVGGGSAGYSMDFGRTWLCSRHYHLQRLAMDRREG